MPRLLSACLLIGLATAGFAHPPGRALRDSHDTPSTPMAFVPGRDQDAQVAKVTFRLAQRGRGLCPVLRPGIGIGLQHLSQFELADRGEQIAIRSLDRGPGVTLVVPGSPAAVAGILPGDVLLTTDGVALPPEQALDLPFAAPRAHARADAILDLIDDAATKAFTITLLRDGAPVSLPIVPASACPARVHLARSGQRNAFADGRHVFLTTGLVSRLRNDDELAFFIAHEMAHNILGHAAVMRSSSVRRGLGRTLGRSGNIIRAAERDADTLGGRLMIAAGYDPVAGAGALLRLDPGLGSPFAVHGSPDDRIAAMQALVRAQQVP